MRVEREWLRTIIFGREGARRFTQDSPILPEVWLAGGAQYCIDRNRRDRSPPDAPSGAQPRNPRQGASAQARIASRPRVVGPRAGSVAPKPRAAPSR